MLRLRKGLGGNGAERSDAAYIERYKWLYRLMYFQVVGARPYCIALVLLVGRRGEAVRAPNKS
jgi:hypothetical protein